LTIGKSQNSFYDNKKNLAEWVNRIPESEIRRLLRFTPQYYFAGGKPGVIPLRIFHTIIQEIIEEEKQFLTDNNPNYLVNYNYGATEGNKTLRKVLANRLKQRDGLKNISENDVVLTNGSQQALYGLCDIILSPGDIILTTRPTYLGFLQPAEKLKGQILTIPSDFEGIIPEFIPLAFRACKKNGHKPKMLYLVPYSDNPKGTTLPERRKRAIIDYAFEYDFLLVEDMAYKEIQFDSTNLSPMKRFDPDNERIVYISTTTKEAAAFRIGYSIFPSSIRDEIIKAKGIYDLCSSEWVQAILTKYYSGFIDQALPSIRNEYQQRRDAMLQACNENLEGKFSNPTGGFFVWFESANSTFNSATFIEIALKNDISYVPGKAFFPLKGLDLHEDGKLFASVPQLNTMRLGYSLLPPELIYKGIGHLGNLLKNLK